MTVSWIYRAMLGHYPEISEPEGYTYPTEWKKGVEVVESEDNTADWNFTCRAAIDSITRQWIKKTYDKHAQQQNLSAQELINQALDEVKELRNALGTALARLIPDTDDNRSSNRYLIANMAMLKYHIGTPLEKFSTGVAELPYNIAHTGIAQNSLESLYADIRDIFNSIGRYFAQLLKMKDETTPVKQTKQNIDDLRDELIDRLPHLSNNESMTQTMHQ